MQHRRMECPPVLSFHTLEWRRCTMDHYLFAVRSATQAQRAARVLNSGGIHASVQRVPVEFARQGCTYAVRVDEADYDVAQQRLQQAHLMPERVLRHSGAGYSEVAV